MLVSETKVVELIVRAKKLCERWVMLPALRSTVESQMYELARAEVGDDPPDYLDIDI
jgi:hypothetical protein